MTRPGLGRSKDVRVPRHPRRRAPVHEPCQRSSLPCHPRPLGHARDGTAGDAPLRSEHLHRRTGRYGARHGARPEGGGAHRPPRRALHRQRPRRVGGGAGQHAVARRPGAGPGHRALLPGLGGHGPHAGRRGRHPRFRPAQPHRHGPRGRGAGRRPRPHDQGGAGRAGRYRDQRAKRHRRAAPNAGRRRASRARVLRQHCLPCRRRVPHGRVGRRRDGDRQPEGADDAAGHGVRVFQRSRPACPRQCRHGHPLLGLAPAHRPVGVLPLLQWHRAHPSPLRPARGAGPDRGRGVGGRLAAARPSGPWRLGRVRGLGPRGGGGAERGRPRPSQPRGHHGAAGPRRRRPAARLADARGRRDAGHPAGHGRGRRARGRDRRLLPHRPHGPRQRAHGAAACWPRSIPGNR